MPGKQSFLKGVALLTGAAIMVKLIGFVYRVVLTNLPGYGDQGNGIYGAGYQVYLLLYALSTTGFPSAISRMVAEKMALGDPRGAHRIFKVSFWLLTINGLILSIAFFAGSGIIARSISSPGAAYTMIALSPTIFLVSIMAVFRGYFQGMRDMGPQAGSQIIEQVGKTLATIILAYVLLPYGVELAAAGATFGTTVGAAVGVLYLCILYARRKRHLWSNIRSFYKKYRPDSTLSIIWSLIRTSIPISLGAVILTAANVIDLTTVMNLLGKAGFNLQEANRLYGILTGKCYVLTHFPASVCVALSTTLVPAIAGHMALRNQKAAADKISASLRLTTLTGFPATVGMAVLAGPILQLLFPGSSEGASLLVLSSFSIIFAGLTQTLSGVLQGLGKSLVPAASLLIGAAFKLVINFWLIPMPGIHIKGAVYGTLVCYILSTIVNLVVLMRKFTLNLRFGDFIMKPMIAAAAMGASVYFSYLWLTARTGSGNASTLLSIGAGMVVYLLLILLSGGVKARDLSAIPAGVKVGNLLIRMKLLRR